DRATLTGSIRGGGGVDTLDYLLYGTRVGVDLALGTASNVINGSVGEITRVIVNAASGATIVGASPTSTSLLVRADGAAATLVVSDTQVTYGSSPGGVATSWSNIQDLYVQGGGGDDTFTGLVTARGPRTTLDGGPGVNTLIGPDTDTEIDTDPNDPDGGVINSTKYINFQRAQLGAGVNTVNALLPMAAMGTTAVPEVRVGSTDGQDWLAPFLGGVEGTRIVGTAVINVAMDGPCDADGPGDFDGLLNFF